MQKKSIGQKIFIVFDYAVMIVLSLLCILPVLHLFALSLSDSTAVSAGKVGFWPVNFTLSSYEFLVKDGKFFTALWISIQRVVLSLVVQLVVLVLTAYPLSRSKDKLLGRDWIMGFFIFTMIFGGGIIPTYLVVSKLGLLNSMWVYPLAGGIGVSNMLILMNFMRGLPQELEEAAIIDGAGTFTVLFKILLPLLKPSLATIALFIIVHHWNDWFGGMIYMQQPERYPLQTYLQSLLKNFDELMQLYGSGTQYQLLISMMNTRTGRAAQLFLASLPVMLVYPYLQKYFTSGLVLGSVKA